jgi:hypothetical protein
MPAIHIDDYAQQRTRMVAQGNIAGAQALEREVESGRRALIIGPR